MKKELKQAIVNYIFENENEFQLLNAATNKFRPYIYDHAGEYIIGGEDVASFIQKAITLLTTK